MYRQIECLNYAKIGCNIDGMCKCAVSYGKLNSLKHLHETGCEIEEEICTIAANNGNLECLKYAHENGGKINEQYDDMINFRFLPKKYNAINNDIDLWQPIGGNANNMNNIHDVNMHDYHEEEQDDGNANDVLWVANMHNYHAEEQHVDYHPIYIPNDEFNAPDDEPHGLIDVTNQLNILDIYSDAM